ncbi:DotA/TraY family protein [Brachymonas denitrificans]|uniref:DotA/TraY family protein n=1 Tax=Brachymonas denitrificans TaxID=28220 RepID=UPI001BCCC88B|nr:DotA/TraY family protein [Brachymonas denitrificans]
MAQMPFSPPQDDVTVGILGHIFGPIIDVLVTGADPNTVSAASSLLGTLFSFFNSGVLVVGSIIVSYVAVMGAVNTANDGEAMGKAWSTVWTPVRIVAGGAVLLPSTSGYSFIQMLVLMISLWSIGFASGINKLGMTMGVFKPDGIVSTSYQTGTYFGLRDFAKQYLAASYCARAANTIYADAAGNPSVMANSASADKQVVTGTRTDYTFFIKDRNAATNLGGGEPICGTVTLTAYAPSGSYSDTSGTQAALDNMRAALMAQKLQAATGLMLDIDNWVNTMPSDINQPGWENVQSAQFNTIVKNREDQVAAAIANSVTTSEGSVNVGVTAFVDEMTKGGWAMAGGWYQRVGLLRSKVSAITGESVGAATTPSLAGLPDDARSKLLKYSVTTVAETISKKSEEAGKGYDGSTAVKPQDIASMLPTDGNADINVGALDADMSTKATLLINGMMQKATDFTIGSGSGVDAVSRMKMTGDLLYSYQAMLWATEFTIKTSITGVRVVSNGLGVTKLAGVDMHGIVSDIWDWALQVPVPIIAKMAQYVGYLAYYFGVAIPSLPYTIFMITVVGWVLGVVQTVIAAPLWAIMHMRPSQTFVGSEAQGYLLLMALFVRPALAVIGLFAAFLVADPLVDYTAKAFFAMRGDVAASTGWPGVLAQFWQFFAWYATFGFLLGAVLTMVFGLPQMLPDKVLAWLNVGVHDLGATSATNEMRAAVSRQGHASGKAALERLAESQSRGGRGGSRGQLPGDGPSGGPSGGRPRGGGSTPVNAGAQGVAPPLDAAESVGANGSQGISSRSLTPTAQPSSGPSNAAPLNAGSSPPTQESEAPRRRLMDKISDGVGVAAGHAVLGAVDAAKSGGQRGGEAMRNGSGPVGGLVAGSIAAAAGAAEALARTAPMVGREGVAAFREGADARIAALKDTSPSPSDEAAQSADQPISAGEQRPNKED